MSKHYAYDIALRSYDLAVRIKKFFRFLHKVRYDRDNIEQLINSSSSVSANIEESKNSSSTKELARYYQIALKSARESIHWLNFLNDTLPASPKEIPAFILEMKELTRILAACLIKLRGRL